MLKDERIQTLILTSFIVFGLYFLAYFLVWAFVTPLQEDLLPTVTEYASFFYLPHGVRVIATAVMGPRAIPSLFLAELGGNYLFWGMTDPLLLLSVSVVGGVITWAAFQGLYSFGINSYYLNSIEKMPRLHTLLFAGLVASVLNGFVLTAILERDMFIGEVTQVMAAYIVGDMTGLLLVILLLKLFLRVLPSTFKS